MRSLVLAAACVISACASLPPSGSSDGAVLSLASDGAIEIRYGFPAGATAVPFADTDDNASFARTHFWSFDRRCFAIRGNALVRLAPSCGDALVRLDWDDVQRDAMYPGVFRLRNGGALVFTGYLQPLTTDRSALAPWRAIAPPGGIARHLDEASTRAIVVDGHEFPHDVSGWVYLGPDRFVSYPMAQVLVDDGIAPRVADEMLRVAPRLLETFAARLDSPLPRKPVFYLAWVKRERPSDSFKADVVAGPVMRIELTGSDWNAPSDKTMADFRRITAHEFAHFWDGREPNTAWVGEGGAEILGWAALHATSLMDDAALAERVDAAFNECAIIAGSESWHAIGERGGRYPYACGAAIQVAAIALARANDPSLDAFAIWKAMLAGDGSDQKTFRAIVHRIAPAGAAALDALLDSDRPLVRSLDGIVRAAGLRRVPMAPEGLDATLRLSLAKQTFFGIMQSDCGGRASMQATDREITALTAKGCHSLAGGMRVHEVDGIPLLAHPVEALRHARHRCELAHEVAVKLEDGRELRIACDASSPLPRIDGLRRFDAGQVARLVDGGKTAVRP